jgi:hypothetical protein
MAVEALLALAGTVICYGSATVLQNVAAQRAEGHAGTDPLLAVRLLRDLPYLAGTVLDGLGFLLSLLALRRLPVFAVQAGVASSIGVTAALAAWCSASGWSPAVGGRWSCSAAGWSPWPAPRRRRPPTCPATAPGPA